MIHIMIALDWETTQTIYVRKYTQEVKAQAINVGGLVFAIFGMGTQLRMETRLEKLPEKTGVIDSEGMTLVYAARHPIITVAALDRKDDMDIAKTRLKILAKEFINRYLDQIPTWREESTGPSTFKSFDSTVD
ncbi:MAG: hypothetical protein ACW976_07725, partial [Candidatus Ranarchaeia archaeon]